MMRRQPNPSRMMPAGRRGWMAFPAWIALGLGLAAPIVHVQAGFAAEGHGIQPVFEGAVANGALFLESKATWLNATTPDKPYVVDTTFTLPACDEVVAARLVMTVWGGTPDSVCELGVQVNGLDVPLAAPLTFGSTADANPLFSATQPSVYGAGSGVWLVGLPVPGDLLNRDGSANSVQFTVNTPDSFDGRINQVTLLAVYQAAALNNAFQFVIAEGSGDIYRDPTDIRVDARTVALTVADPAAATAARLHALYTYADIGQNDLLRFNGTQLGGDDLAGWDKAGSSLDYGPNLLSFDVLDPVTANNQVTFSVSATDLPDTREFSLRPQLAVLEVTRPAGPPVLTAALNLVITWPVSTENYQLEFRPEADTGEWTPVDTAPVGVHGWNMVVLPPDQPREYYRLRRIE